MNITNKILLALKFESKYSEIFSKQESALLDKQENGGLNPIVIFLVLDREVAMQ